MVIWPWAWKKEVEKQFIMSSWVEVEMWLEYTTKAKPPCYLFTSYLRCGLTAFGGSVTIQPSSAYNTHFDFLTPRPPYFHTCTVLSWVLRVGESAHIFYLLGDLCPLTTIMDLVAGPWKLLILRELLYEIQGSFKIFMEKMEMKCVCSSSVFSLEIKMHMCCAVRCLDPVSGSGC